MSTNVTVRGDPTGSVDMNLGYFRTGHGMLKFLQVLLGAIIIGIVAYYFDRHRQLTTMLVPEVFFLIVAVAALIGSFCLLLSHMLSTDTASMMPQTLFEPIFYVIIAGLYLAASIHFMVETCHRRRGGFRTKELNSYLAAAILGLLNAMLYLWSWANSIRRFRKI
jgi:hypothetical protein